MKRTENERRDWIIILLILLFGLLCLLLAGEWALRFAPFWVLNASAGSVIDPNSDFLTNRPDGYIEPVNPAILTNPAWIDLVLTPGVSLPTKPPAVAISTKSTRTALATGTVATAQTTSTIIAIPSTNTIQVFPSPTNTLVFIPPPPPSATSKPKRKPKPTATATSIATATTKATSTATSTATATSTSTNTPTATATPTATSPSSCTTTITITGTSGSYPTSIGTTCFEYTNNTFTNGSVFQITSSGNGTVNGSSCPVVSLSSGIPANYGVEQSGGLMTFRITGTVSGTVTINVSDWITYPTCP